MCPRGEVGAGALMISLRYGIKGPILFISVISLAFNICCSGIFIYIVKALLDKT